VLQAGSRHPQSGAGPVGGGLHPTLDQLAPSNLVVGTRGIGFLLRLR
jgi:hypothetical protein